MQTPGDGEAFRIESEDFHALFKATRDYDKKLYAELRKGLRIAAKPMVDDVKAEIGRIPSSGKYRGSIRAGLAAGTRASILASSARTAGVRILTSPSRLPANKKPLAKAMNKATFRHPVFADPERVRNANTRRARLAARITGRSLGSWVWVEQQGRPYFGATIARHFDEVRDEMGKAYLRTAEQLPNFTGGTTP